MKPKVRYFAETDTLAIEVAREPAAEAEEVAEDLILDYDAARRVGRHHHRARKRAPRQGTAPSATPVSPLGRNFEFPHPRVDRR